MKQIANNAISMGRAEMIRFEQIDQQLPIRFPVVMLYGIFSVNHFGKCLLKTFV